MAEQNLQEGFFERLGDLVGEVPVDSVWHINISANEKGGWDTRSSVFRGKPESDGNVGEVGDADGLYDYLLSFGTGLGKWAATLAFYLSLRRPDGGPRTSMELWVCSPGEPEFDQGDFVCMQIYNEIGESSLEVLQ